jgi:hypothetical protein
MMIGLTGLILIFSLEFSAAAVTATEAALPLALAAGVSAIGTTSAATHAEIATKSVKRCFIIYASFPLWG